MVGIGFQPMHSLWIAFDKEEWIHLLSLSDDKLVLEVVGGVLHHCEVDQGAGQKNNYHGVSEGQDELGRKFTGGAG